MLVSMMLNETMYGTSVAHRFPKEGMQRHQEFLVKMYNGRSNHCGVDGRTRFAGFCIALSVNVSLIGMNKILGGTRCLHS